MKKSNKFSLEVRERAVRIVRWHKSENPSRPLSLSFVFCELLHWLFL